jgi:Putative adhesin
MMTRTPPVNEHTIGRDGLLVVRLTDGDARLTGVDGDRVTIRSDESGDLDGFVLERGERSLEISTQGVDSADLDIDVPAGATVILEARSADVTVSNLMGDVRLKTASGDLTLRGVGGTLTVEAVSGDLEIVASGSLRLEARTVSGDIDLLGRDIERLQATTTSGDLTIAGRFVGAGPFAIETVSGDTSLAPLGDVRVEATTLTGDIHGRGIGRRSSRDPGPIVIGSGNGPTIAFRSTSGDLAIEPRDADQPRIAAEAPSTTTESTTTDATATDDDATLVILRDLERGDIDLDAARLRLAALDADGSEDRDA